MKHRIELKRLTIVDNKPVWNRVPAEELLHKSIVDFLLASEMPAVACLYDGEKPAAFLANREELFDKFNMRERGLCLTAETLKDLLGSTVVPPPLIYIDTFKDAMFAEVKEHKEKGND